jgi:hypothetical protein
LATCDLLHRCSGIRDALIGAGLFSPRSSEYPASPGNQEAIKITQSSWRIGVEPLMLSQDQLTFFQDLGPKLLSFYRALNRLYFESARGTQPAWVAAYLDQGKPDGLVTYSRMKRFREHLPAVIRPDIIPTADGMVITELDSVPGGIGLTAALNRVYADAVRHSSSVEDTFAAGESSSSCLPQHDYEIVGGRDGMVRGFAAMLREHRGSCNGAVAIVVSEEAKDYRPKASRPTALILERSVSRRRSFSLR